jgi:hypothetical protein
MKIKALSILSAFSLWGTLQTPAQDTLNHKAEFPSGIFLGYGRGSYAVIDEYVSKEKYSGSMPCYNVGWVRFHNRNGYRLQFEYWKTTDITNNNISAEAQQFNFNQDFFYPIGSFSLFSRMVNAYLGPSVQLFYYEIYYHFVSPGTFISPTTRGIIGSLGVNTELIYHFNSKLKAEGFFRSNLVSYGGKKIDQDKYANESSPAVLSVFTATKLDFDLSLRYCLINRVSFSLGYRFDLSRINKWDPYVAASNNLMVSFNFKI